ncbi:MAG: hypothetical protein SangKO_011340 [Sandaracinaceae bacterium]
MSQSFMRLQRAAFDASRGSRTQAEAFGALGVQLRDGNGQLLAADELMRQMARGMAGLEDETAKVALAQTLMGRSGARLLPLLNGGEEGAEALLERFRELGGGLSADFVVSAEAAQDAITDWNTATLSFKSQLGAAFLPTLTRVLLAVTEYGTLIASAVRRSNAVQVAFWGARDGARRAGGGVRDRLRAGDGGTGAVGAALLRRRGPRHALHGW